MLPALHPGDRLLVVQRRPRVGDVVALVHGGRTMVKRVASIGADGVTVVGDNAEASTDSRSFGPVEPVSILGRVVYRYAPVGRAGSIPSRRG
jgi:nickel-type superoxide dismutase maturation protease